MSDNYYNLVSHRVSPTLLPKRLETSDITLEMRQQPGRTLVTSSRNKRSRKPIDPAPVVRMIVSREADSTELFLHNPHIFAMVALELPDGKKLPLSQLEGATCASLMRLKDIDDEGSWGPDCGFFVFTDISIAMQGIYRLKFHIYERRIDVVHWLQEGWSSPFHVVAQKDFVNQNESTILTRALSEQGVRVRLRKDRRSSASQHRSSISQVGEEFLSPDELIDGSPQKRQVDAESDADSDGDQRPSKRLRNETNRMYAGINQNTKGWSAFNTNDLQEFHAPIGSQANQSATVTDRHYWQNFLANPTNLSFSSNPATRPGVAPEPVSFESMPVLRNQYRGPAEAQQLSPRQIPGHARNSSSQSSLSNHYSLIGAQNVQLSQAFLGNSAQQMGDAYSAPVVPALDNTWQQNPSFDGDETTYNNTTALQTLARASQQHPYLSNPNLAMAIHSTPTLPSENMINLVAGAQQRQMQMQLPQTQMIPRSNFIGETFDIADTRPASTTYLDSAENFAWTSSATPMGDTSNDEVKSKYGDV